MDGETYKELQKMNAGTKMEGVILDRGKLWGVSGGELEFVGVRFDWRKQEDGSAQRIAVLRFTDHDVWATDGGAPVEKFFYEFDMILGDVD